MITRNKVSLYLNTLFTLVSCSDDDMVRAVCLRVYQILLFDLVFLLSWVTHICKCESAGTVPSKTAVPARACITYEGELLWFNEKQTDQNSFYNLTLQESQVQPLHCQQSATLTLRGFNKLSMCTSSHPPAMSHKLIKHFINGIKQ